MSNSFAIITVAIITGLFSLITATITSVIVNRKDRRNWKNETAIKFIEYSLTKPEIAKKVARQFSIAVLVQIDEDGSTLGKFFLPAFCRFTIGRSVDHDLTINDPYLSRDHGLFYYSKGKMYYKDTSALNATSVNGKKISESRRLKTGDILILGKTRMKFVML